MRPVCSASLEGRCLVVLRRHVGWLWQRSQAWQLTGPRRLGSTFLVEVRDTWSMLARPKFCRVDTCPCNQPINVLLHKSLHT